MCIGRSDVDRNPTANKSNPIYLLFWERGLVRLASAGRVQYSNHHAGISAALACCVFALDKVESKGHFQQPSDGLCRIFTYQKPSARHKNMKDCEAA
jgi:hypothetical protein